MTITELVLRNSLGCELGRYEAIEDDAGVNMVKTFQQCTDLQYALTLLAEGDTITVETRWTERD